MVLEYAIPSIKYQQYQIHQQYQASIKWSAYLKSKSKTKLTGFAVRFGFWRPAYLYILGYQQSEFLILGVFLFFYMHNMIFKFVFQVKM